jgi:hypothetical protein
MSDLPDSPVLDANPGSVARVEQRGKVCALRTTRDGWCVLAVGHLGDCQGPPRREGPEPPPPLGTRARIPPPSPIVSKIPGWTVVHELTCPTCLVSHSRYERLPEAVTSLTTACALCGAKVVVEVGGPLPVARHG